MRQRLNGVLWLHGVLWLNGPTVALNTGVVMLGDVPGPEEGLALAFRRCAENTGADALPLTD